MSIIFILAALGLTFGYTNPTYRGASGSTDVSKKSVTELIEERTQYTAALQKTREIEEVRNGLLTKYNLISEADRANLGKMIPDNIDSVRLIIDINNIATAYNMSLRDIDISDAKIPAARKDNPGSLLTPTGYSYINLGFSVTGTYASVLSFLSDLEKDLRLSDIASLSLVPSGDVSQTGQGGSGSKTKVVKTDPQYKMEISLKTYYLISK